MMNTIGAASAELTRLLEFLERDPSNLGLLRDTATLAYDESQLGVVEELLNRYRALATLPAALLNLSALVALRSDQVDSASEMFQTLRDSGHGNPELRFNLAWCRALQGNYEAALALLSDEAVQARPQGATLRVQMLHHLGALDEALDAGLGYAERFPEDTALLGALAQVALDAERTELAADYAERAIDTVEGRSVKAMLLLAEERDEEALEMFDVALAERPDDPRALIGRGIALLNKGDQAGALESIRRGAERFGSHSGSWIAAGWLHLLDQDRSESRYCFEQALTLDDTFAESHGGLAVLDILEGDMTSGQRRAETALRLDPKSLGGTLAKILALQGQGDARKAERLIEAALKTPVGPGGQTIARAVGTIGLGGAPLRPR